MNETSLTKLSDAGVDVEGALERFMGNTSMYEKFLRKFINDPNHDALKQAVEEKDCEKAFTAAHTLKGVCSNLSLIPLYEVVAKQTEHFRAGNFDEGAVLMPDVDAVYADMLALIDSLE